MDGQGVDGALEGAVEGLQRPVELALPGEHLAQNLQDLGIVRRQVIGGLGVLMGLANFTAGQAGPCRADQRLHVAGKEPAGVLEPCIGRRTVAVGQGAQPGFLPYLSDGRIVLDGTGEAGLCAGKVARLQRRACQRQRVVADRRRQIGGLVQVRQGSVGLAKMQVRVGQLEVPRRFVVPFHQ